MAELLYRKTQATSIVPLAAQPRDIALAAVTKTDYEPGHGATMLPVAREREGALSQSVWDAQASIAQRRCTSADIDSLDCRVSRCAPPKTGLRRTICADDASTEVRTSSQENVFPAP